MPRRVPIGRWPSVTNGYETHAPLITEDDLRIETRSTLDTDPSTHSAAPRSTHPCCSNGISFACNNRFLLRASTGREKV